MGKPMALPPPLLSVVIPLHNGRKFLPGLLKCVREQRTKGLELILVDDGSTDGTAAAARRLSDGKIRLLALRPSGPCAATNAGLKAARGKYVAILEMDDLWRPWKTREQLKLFEAHRELVWSATDVTAFDRRTGKTLPPGYLEKYRDPRPVIRGYENFSVRTSTFLARREAVARIGFFDERYKYYYYDPDYYRRLFRAFGPRRCAFVGRPCVLYNVGSPQRITNRFKRALAGDGPVSRMGRELYLDSALWLLSGKPMTSYPMRLF